METLITSQKIQEVADKIAKEYQPEKIILFGSYAWGKPHKDSDVDLFIIKETENSKITAREINRSIFPRPFAIDLIVHTFEEAEKSVNENKNLFIEDILRHGKVLYSNSKSAFDMKLPRRPLTILH